jgi:xanthine dehydrogenase small subunit
MTMSELQDSEEIRKVLPNIAHYLAPIGSTQIRNMATIGGNLVNASPIGDLTIMLLGLDADIYLRNGNEEQKMKLRDFYLGYKQLNKSKNAILQRIAFDIPDGNWRFHFERVCKRKFLDVASVNSACSVKFNANRLIQQIHLSAGGVAPIPMYMQRTTAFMTGKEITEDVIREATEILQSEVTPISDIRGSAEYKRLLLRQQFFIHMTTLSDTPLLMHKLIEA